jgi:hypothetical protein
VCGRKLGRAPDRAATWESQEIRAALSPPPSGDDPTPVEGPLGLPWDDEEETDTERVAVSAARERLKGKSSQMKKLSGRGAWIAFEDAVTPQGRAADIAETVRRAKQLGAAWVALRLGNAGVRDGGSHINGKPAMDLVDALRSENIDLAGWLFEYQKWPEASRAIWRDWSPLLSAAIINAEFEYLDATEEMAKRLVGDLRGMGYEEVSHAPPDYAGGRGDGAMKYLDELCDRILPQVYSYEHDDSGAPYHLARIKALYEKRGLLAKVSPVGCTYRPFVRGGRKLSPIGDEAVASDVVKFLDDAWTLTTEIPSLYSIDAPSFAGEGRAAVFSAVEAYDGAHPYRGRVDGPTDTDPTPPALRGEPEEQASVATVLDLVSKP